jgi:hypothetical protein
MIPWLATIWPSLLWAVEAINLKRLRNEKATQCATVELCFVRSWAALMLDVSP